MSLRFDLRQLDSKLWSNDEVLFQPLKTEEDLVYATYDCQLSEKQKDMINPAWFSIGRAYLHPKDNYPCVICKKSGEPIGFINLSKWLGNGEAYTWSFFIDQRYQGKGLGRSAAQLAVDILTAANPNMCIKLAAEKNNEKAQRLYISLGFRELPELDGDDLVFGL